MKKMRKVLALVVALTFLFSVIAPLGGAFAADDSSTTAVNEKAEKAGNQLLGLDMITGYTDGTLGLDKQITRAEAAVILARMSGMGSAAETLKSTPSKFKDVKANEWYTGWINLAASQGWIKGDPDGKFRPNDNVQYREIITMVVKTLGYNDNLPGQWPANYLAKASALGITDGISFDAKTAAVRGDVFRIVAESLDEYVVYFDNEKNDFMERVNTLLEEKHNLTKQKDSVVTEVARVNKAMKSNEMKVANESGKEKTYKLLVGDPMEYFGQEVTIWYNSDSEIKWIKLDTDSSDAYKDVIKEVDPSKEEVTLKFADKDLDVSEDVVIWVNDTRLSGKVEAKLEDVEEYGPKKLYGSIIVNNGEVTFMALNNFDEVESGLVTKVSDDYIDYKIDDTDKKVSLKDFDEVYAYDLNQKLVKVADIKADSLIYAWENKNDELILYVVDKAVEGKLEKVSTSNAYVDGKKYDVAKGATASDNNDEDIYDFVKDDDIDGVVEDLAGQTVKAIIDIKGEIRHVRGTSVSTSGTQYGLLVTADRTGATIFNAEGKEVFYKAEKRADISTFDSFYGKETNDKYLPVEYRLTKAGEIKDGSLKAVDGVMASGSNETLTINDPNKFEAGKSANYPGVKVNLSKKDYLTVGNDTYYVGSKTVIMKYDQEVDGKNDDNSKVLKWDDIKDNEADNAYVAVIGEKGKDADLVVIYRNFDQISSEDYYYAVVTEKQAKNADGDWEIKLAVSANDDIKDGWILLSDKLDPAPDKGDLVRFEINSNKEIKATSSFEIVSKKETSATPKLSAIGEVKEIKNKDLTLKDNNKYRFDSDSIVYSLKDDAGLDKAKSYSDITEKDTVILLLDEEIPTLVKAALITTKYTGGSVTPGDPVASAGTVTYINADATRMMIKEGTNEPLLIVNDDTKIFDANKNIFALGTAEIKTNKNFIENKKVVDVKVVDGKLVSLRLQANFTALNSNIQTVEALNAGAYEAEGWSALQVKLTAAKKVAANGLSTQTEVDDANTALTVAKNALVAKNADTSLATLKYGANSITPINTDNDVVLPYGTAQVPVVTADANASTSSVNVVQANSVSGTSVNRTAVVTVTAADGSTKDYTVTFSVATVTGITVKTLPSDVTYTGGDNLNLAGLEVTINYSDGTSEDVALADFATKGLSVDPADGTALSTGTVTVEVEHVDGETDTFDLTVS